MAGRKQRIDSATAAVKVMQAATRELQPPEHLPLAEKDWPFWRSIVAEKAKAEWTDHDLEMAAMLAMSMRRLGEQEVKLEIEGPVTTTSGGNVAQNPRCRVVADIHARVIKYRQTLGIHNRGKNGEKRDTDKRSEQARGLEADLGDELLARPSIQ